MKNIAIIAAIAITASLIYKYALNNPDTQTVSSEPTGSQTDELELLSPAADGAAVFIMEPGDGTVVNSPITVKFGVTNMTITEAGDKQEFSGHHHLLINMDELPPLDQPLPANDQLIHFGGGQTETTIELEPGQHTLQLLLGNYLHIPHSEPVISKKITITVE